jgi:molecular chaperone GrpE
LRCSRAAKRSDGVQIMLKIFKENGLEAVESEVGQDFDPRAHNAMFEIPTADVEPGRIAAIVKRGYVLNGRVIRATDVGVAKPLE